LHVLIEARDGYASQAADGDGADLIGLDQGVHGGTANTETPCGVLDGQN
jgi:hypothetical protein